MRHRNQGRKLGKTSSHRTAMFANMAAALIKHEQIKTTLPKAKELRPVVEKLVTLSRRNDLHARRQALRVVRGREVQAKLFGDLAQRFAGRQGGYTRVLRTRRRAGDAAEMSIVSLLEPAAPAKPAVEKGGKRAPRKKAAAPKKSEQSEKPARQKAGTQKADAKKGARKKKKSSAKED